VFVRGGVGRTLPETIGDGRAECNIILCTSKSEAAVTSNKNCAVGMLKLTTDKHEASRGLFATAEPFVAIVVGRFNVLVKRLIFKRLTLL